MNKKRENKIKLILSLYEYDKNMINYIIIIWAFILLILILVIYLF